MTPKQCPGCSNLLAEDVKICVHCGHVFEEDIKKAAVPPGKPTPSIFEPKKPNYLAWGLAIGFFVLLLGSLVYVNSVKGRQADATQMDSLRAFYAQPLGYWVSFDPQAGEGAHETQVVALELKESDIQVNVGKGTVMVNTDSAMGMKREETTPISFESAQKGKVEKYDAVYQSKCETVPDGTVWRIYKFHLEKDGTGLLSWEQFDHGTKGETAEIKMVKSPVEVTQMNHLIQAVRRWQGYSTNKPLAE